MPFSSGYFVVVLKSPGEQFPKMRLFIKKITLPKEGHGKFQN